MVTNSYASHRLYGVATFFTPLSILAIFAFSVAAPADAALVSAAPPSCSPSDLTPDTGTVDACSGAWEGNNVNQQADVLAQLTIDAGAGPWTYAETVDEGDSSSVLQTVPGVSSGTLTFEFPIKGPFAIALKAANQFSLYVLDGGATGITTIDFITDGVSVNKNGMAQDLSHVSLYAPLGLDPFDNPVPEPSAILLVAACAGLLATCRR